MPAWTRFKGQRGWQEPFGSGFAQAFSFFMLGSR
jgi:hypothetical protein